MFSKRSRGNVTLNQSNIEILARRRPGKMARMVTLTKIKLVTFIFVLTDLILSEMSYVRTAS